MKNTKFKGYIINENGTVEHDVAFGESIVRPYQDQYGYVYIDLDKSYRLHRLIWEAFNGAIPKNMQVDHMDSDRTNNALSNLQLLSPSENSRKAWLSSPNRCTGKQAVIQMDIEYNYIASFPSMAAAGRAVNGDGRRISEVCNQNNDKETHRGYR